MASQRDMVSRAHVLSKALDTEYYDKEIEFMQMQEEKPEFLEEGSEYDEEEEAHSEDEQQKDEEEEQGVKVDRVDKIFIKRMHHDFLVRNFNV